MAKGTGFVAALVAGLCAFAGQASACTPRASVPGHWEWQGDGHVWVPAHPTLPARAYAWHAAAPSAVRDVAHDRDERQAQEQPRDLDRRLAR
jgi:hypothetical protein